MARPMSAAGTALADVAQDLRSVADLLERGWLTPEALAAFYDVVADLSENPAMSAKFADDGVDSSATWLTKVIADQVARGRSLREEEG